VLKFLFALLLVAAPSIKAGTSASAVALASLTDPAKLATLKRERGIGQCRLLKATHPHNFEEFVGGHWDEPVRIQMLTTDG